MLIVTAVNTSNPTPSMSHYICLFIWKGLWLGILDPWVTHKQIVCKFASPIITIMQLQLMPRSKVFDDKRVWRRETNLNPFMRFNEGSSNFIMLVVMFSTVSSLKLCLAWTVTWRESMRRSSGRRNIVESASSQSLWFGRDRGSNRWLPVLHSGRFEGLYPV